MHMTLSNKINQAKGECTPKRLILKYVKQDSPHTQRVRENDLFPGAALRDEEDDNQWLSEFSKSRKHLHGVAVERHELERPSGPNQVWSMDFVRDALANGCRITVRTIVDDFRKEAIDLAVDCGISDHFQRTPQYFWLHKAARSGMLSNEGRGLQHKLR